jgi:hypothetical protein
MIKVYMVITNGGDGSNSIQWVLDDKVIDRMEELVDDDDEAYSSGDGLQVTTLGFPDDFDLATWMKLNYLSVTTLKDLDY